MANQRYDKTMLDEKNIMSVASKLTEWHQFKKNTFLSTSGNCFDHIYKPISFKSTLDVNSDSKLNFDARNFENFQNFMFKVSKEAENEGKVPILVVKT